MFGSIQDLYPVTPYIRQSSVPVLVPQPGISEIESAIRRRIDDELYARGYGEQRFGNIDGENWGIIALVVLLGAGLLWGK